MFVKKIGLIVTGTALAMFGMARIESLAAHRGFSGSTAFAQQWTDPSDDSATDDSATPSVPDITGSYSGTLDDHKLGIGDVSMDITQTGKKITGSWTATFGGPGTLKGVVTSKGRVLARLKITGQGACGLNVEGKFANGNEISGHYQVTGCGHSDHGTFDMTD
jgi:hypothetical protein